MRNSFAVGSIAVLCLAHVLASAGVRTSPANDIAIKTGSSADSQLELRYTLPSAGFVTLVIDDAHGRRVRNLIGAAPRGAGAHTELWDGADDQGQPVPAGPYRWRVLRHNGVGIEYLLSYGNPGTPPWATADSKGGWGADHTLPQAAITIPGGVVLGWPMAESGWFLVGVGPDGRKDWGLKNRFAFGDTLINLASDGQYLYVASEQNAAPLMRYYKKMAHSVLYRYRLSDRKLARFGD
ncbi:MAG TPA: FlgD immunoglobulin-like domain containing protein, partial [bacterium]